MARWILFLLLATLIIMPLVASAGDAREASVINPLPVGLELLVKYNTVVIPPRGAYSSPVPATVCVPYGSLQVYTGEGVLKVFSGWLVDNVYSGNDTCIRVDGESVVEPLYRTLYRVVVNSNPPGVYYNSIWVEPYRVYEVTVPSVVEGEEARYVFKGWGLQELPPSTRITIPVIAPTTLTVLYDVEYRVRVYDAAGDVSRILYVASGKVLDLRRVLEARIEYVGTGARDVLSKILVNGVELPRGTYTIAVNEPLDIVPVYTREYLVKVESPVEVKSIWAPEGANITVSVPGEVKVNETVKLVFTGWEGVGAEAPTVVLRVTGPLTIKALYHKVFKVTINSPLGVDEVWAAEGETLPLVLPTRLPGVVYDRVLKYYIAGERIIPVPREGVALLKVDQPLRVTAVYTVRANWYHLAVITGFVLALLAIYLALSLREAGQARE